MTGKKPLIILTGPTAVGKTALSIRLAKEIGGEIISADSMQVYKYMDIGSAKIKQAEMEGVPHHLIDILNPDEAFNVYMFQKMAKKCAEDIYQRGKIPIVVGGTGFYIQALLYDIEFEEEEERASSLSDKPPIGKSQAEELLAETLQAENPHARALQLENPHEEIIGTGELHAKALQVKSEIRKKLEQLALEKGSAYLHSLLKEVDPESAAEIHENNQKRVIRALEFYEKNKMPISRHNREQRQREAAYSSCYFVLNDDREKLYERINQRADQMLSEGLLDEVKSLKEMGCHKGMVSMQGLGYKELLSYLEGACSLEEAVNLMKQDSRHFAKRQLTWFRREREVIWIQKPEFSYDDDKILAFMKEQIRMRQS